MIKLPRGFQSKTYSTIESYLALQSSSDLILHYNNGFNSAFNCPTQGTGTIKLSANIGLDYGEAGYDARAEFMDIGISASAGATLENFALYLEAEMCINPGCSLQVFFSNWPKSNRN